MFKIKFSAQCPGGEPIDLPCLRVGNVERLVRLDRKVIAGRIAPRQIPAKLGRARGKIESPQRRVSLCWSRIWRGRKLASPQRIVCSVGQHAKKERPRAL